MDAADFRELDRADEKIMRLRFDYDQHRDVNALLQISAIYLVGVTTGNSHTYLEPIVLVNFEPYIDDGHAKKVVFGKTAINSDIFHASREFWRQIAKKQYRAVVANIMNEHFDSAAEIGCLIAEFA